MVPFIFANNIKTTLAAALSSSGTTVTLASASGLPTIPAGSYMPLTLNDSATGLVYEVLYVTAISGATLTVMRGQEGTSAQTWAIGDIAFVGPTASPFQNAIAEITNAIAGAGLTPTAGSLGQLLTTIQTIVPTSFVAPAAAGGTSLAIGASFSNTQTASFTAAKAGTVMAFGKLNVSSAASAGITCALKVNGTTVSSDTTVASQSHFGAQAVSAGAVSVTFDTTTGSTSPAINATPSVGFIFIPGA